MSTPPTPSRESNDELVRLRARVSELEADADRRNTRDRVDQLEDESASRGTRRRRFDSRGEGQSRRYRDSGTRRSTGDVMDDVEDTARDTVSRAADSLTRATDESRRVLRSLVLASLEPLRTSADVIGSFVDDVYSRNRPEDDDTVSDVAMRLPNDIMSSFTRAVNRSFDAIPNTVDTYYDAYREVESRTRRDDSSRGGSSSRSGRSSRSQSGTGSGGAPHVVATTPRGGSSGPAPSVVMIIFDADVQPTGADYGTSVTVRRAGADVRGTVSYSGLNALVWTPEAALTAGLYTVRVSDVEGVPNGYTAAMDQPFVFSFTVVETAAATGRAGSRSGT